MCSDLITLRPALPEDVPSLTTLCEALGYPSTENAVGERLAQMSHRPDHALFVAEHASAGIIGWVHVYVGLLLESGRQAEIGGLVVSAAYRRGGVGKRLMQRAEQWALAQHCLAVRLRSNLVREDAHAFYRALGYQVTKTSLTFRKALPEAEG